MKRKTIQNVEEKLQAFRELESMLGECRGRKTSSVLIQSLESLAEEIKHRVFQECLDDYGRSGRGEIAGAIKKDPCRKA